MEPGYSIQFYLRLFTSFTSRSLVLSTCSIAIGSSTLSFLLSELSVDNKDQLKTHAKTRNIINIDNEFFLYHLVKNIEA